MSAVPAMRTLNRPEVIPVIVPLETGSDPLSAFSSERPSAPSAVTFEDRQVAIVSSPERRQLPPTERGPAPRLRVRVPAWLGTGSVAIVAGALGGLVIAAALAPRAATPTPAIDLLAHAPERFPAPVAVASAPCAPPPVAHPAALVAAVAAAPAATARGGAITGASRNTARASDAPRVPAPPRIAAAPVLTGTLTVSSAFPVRVLVDGQEVGTSGTSRLSVPAGTHTVTLINDALEFEQRIPLDIAARRTARVTVEPSTGTLHVNAQPWAQVWIDGRRAGETPLGNLTLPIGDHEVVLRHPELGEQRHTVTIGARTPVHVGVEFSR